MRTLVFSLAMSLCLVRSGLADTLFVDDFDNENGAPSGWTFVGTGGAVETAANSSVIINGGASPNQGRLRSDPLFSFTGTTTILTIDEFQTASAVLGIRDTVDDDALFLVFANQGDRFLITSFSDGVFNFASVVVADGTGYTGGALVMSVDITATGLTVTMDQPFFAGGTLNSFTDTWANLFGATNGFDPSQLGSGDTGYQLAVRSGTLTVDRIELLGPSAGDPVPEPGPG